VSAGKAIIASPAANQLTINQSSHQAINNWNSFDVGSQGKVNFAQPDSNAGVQPGELGSAHPDRFAGGHKT
jgi:hypothetical protein